MQTATAIVVAAVLIAFVVGCSDGGSRAQAIVCSTAYRVSQTEPLTDVDQMRFADEDATQSVPYIYLEVHAQYNTGRADSERSLRLWVTPPGEDEVLHAQLFLLDNDAGPENQFEGGHGFTGLNYVYDPESGAELQYWCEVE